MGKIYEMKGYLVKYYGKYSRYVDKALQFILALVTFTYINQNIGFSNIVSNPIMTIILSIICMLLPMPLTVVFATIAVIVQVSMVSLGMAIVAIILFVVSYALYFRFASGNSIILLLVPIAFMLKIPIVIPIIFGLIGSPVCIFPISVGTVTCYMIQYIKSNATVLKSATDTGLFEQVALHAQQLFSNREMWCIIIALAISLLLTYCVRRMSVDYAWEIAAIAGALGNINVMAYGYIIMDIDISYLALILGSVLAILVALILKVFVFSVDYTRTEYLQFEDDEYYYYVKAVPKASVAIPEKTVKRINERQKTGVIDVEQVLKEENLPRQEVDESEIQRIIEEELKQEK